MRSRQVRSFAGSRPVVRYRVTSASAQDGPATTTPWPSPPATVIIRAPRSARRMPCAMAGVACGSHWFCTISASTSLFTTVAGSLAADFQNAHG